MYRILIEYSGRDHRIGPSSHYGDVIDSIEIDSVDGPSLGGSYQVNLATKPTTANSKLASLTNRFKAYSLVTA